MTLDQLRAAIARCADNAIRDYPGDGDQCARNFIARLSGCLDMLKDKELADKLFSLLQHKDQSS